MIYLDNAASTRTLPEVTRSMMRYYMTDFGNPDSSHGAGIVAKDAVERAREQVDKLIGANGFGKIIFTSGGTEANNIVFTLLSDFPLFSSIITSKTEHKSVLEPIRLSGASAIKYIKPGEKGYVSSSDLTEVDIPKYTIVSLMYVNNETGMINDVYEIGNTITKLREIGVLYHVDCVQAAGALPINVSDMGADMISISAHKLHGPKGVGCLWVSDNVLNCIKSERALRLIVGGGQESGFRAGTLNVPGIVGFGAAAEIASSVQYSDYHKQESSFIDELSRCCYDKSIRFSINKFDESHHFGKVLSITFMDADAETVVLLSSEKGLCISSGAACNSVLSMPSYVLTNSGMSPDLARSTVRVSFSRYDDEEYVRAGARILADAVSESIELNKLAFDLTCNTN